MAKVGRKPDERRFVYQARFNLSEHKTVHRMSKRLLDQLDNCKSDVERRLILGKSR